MRLLLPVVALGLVACAPRLYVPPSAAEPHAELTLRVLHHEVSGVSLDYQVLVGEFELPLGAASVGQSSSLTRHVRVRPESEPWRFRTHFFHRETRMVTVFENERVPCGTQRTGYGRGARTSTRYCQRTVQRRRLRTTTVTDGRCEAHLQLTPQAAERYVVQYDYYGHGACRARCFVRSPGVGGHFSLRPCAQGTLRRVSE